MPQSDLSPRERMLAALRRSQASLDELLAETELGPRNHNHYDALEERAQVIAAEIVSAFRKPQPGPVVKAGRNGGVWVG